MAASLALKPVEILLERVIDKAISTVKHHVSLVVNVREEIAFLREILPEVRDLVLSVTDHDDVPRSTRTFLQALRFFVYDAEDILDEFDTEISRRRWEDNCRKQRKATTAPSSSHDDKRRIPLRFRWKIAKQIKGLYEELGKIQDVKTRRNDFFSSLENTGLHHVTVSDPSTRWLSQSRPITDEVVASDFKMVGRGDMKGRIIEKLLKVTCHSPKVGIACGDSETCPDCSCRPLVLLITGMGGLGKTTLAQEIFRDPQVVEHFKSFRKWVSVGDGELDPNKVMGKIMGRDDPVKEREELRKELDGKKFLIVLDDVWKGEKLGESWTYLREPLSHGGSGSRVIITTREGEGVKNGLMGRVKVEVENLFGLEDDKCLQIFERCAFPIHGVLTEEKLKKKLLAIGQQIVEKKIKGVPLAATIIGSSLSNEREERQWKNALQQIGHKDLNSAIMWSYKRLPTPLKQCFLYLSLFPKDSELDKTEIIRMWIALGYVVQSDDGECCLEDIAEWYFDYLVKVSLVLYVDDSYCLHDLVHDFGTSTYKSVHTVTSEPPIEIQEPMVVRHLHVDYFGLPRNYSDIRKLRTFITYNYDDNEVNKLRIDRLETVRVMSVYVISINLDFQKLIKSMMHLRYLNLRSPRLDRVSIKSLPESLCSLYNLQTLILPWKLKQLPKNMWKLVNLRHLCKEFGKMPIINRIEELTSLQTIGGIQLSENNRGKDIRVLHRLPQTGQLLHISGLRFLRDINDARYARLEEKKYLHALCLDMDVVDSDPIEPKDQNEETLCKEVLDNLKPHHNLEKLEISKYYGRELPTWIGDGYLCNLKSVKFSHISNSVQSMPPLGLLPKLEVLKMYGGKIKRIGNEMYGGRVEVVFPSLKQIELLDMDELEEWEEVNSEDKGDLINKYFPCLKEIIVRGCTKLRCLPRVPTSLESFEILNSRMDAIPKVWGRDDDSTGNTFSLPNLKCLLIMDCPELDVIKTDFQQWLDGMSSLEHLDLSKMRNLKKLVLHNHCFLKYLDIYDCPDLSSIDGIKGLTALERLELRTVSAGFKVEMDEVNNALQNLRFLYTGNWEILKAVDPRSLRQLELNFRSNILDLDRDVSCEEHQWLNSWWGNLQSIQKISFYYDSARGLTRENCPPWILQVEDLQPHIRIEFEEW